MDFQFLIVCLWRMRLAGRSAAEAADEVRSALAAFDREIPDLALTHWMAASAARRRQPDTPGLHVPLRADMSHVRWGGGRPQADRSSGQVGIGIDVDKVQARDLAGHGLHTTAPTSVDTRRVEPRGHESLRQVPNGHRPDRERGRRPGYRRS